MLNIENENPFFMLYFLRYVFWIFFNKKTKQKKSYGLQLEDISTFKKGFFKLEPRSPSNLFSKSVVTTQGQKCI